MTFRVTYIRHGHATLPDDFVAQLAASGLDDAAIETAVVDYLREHPEAVSETAVVDAGWRPSTSNMGYRVRESQREQA